MAKKRSRKKSKDGCEPRCKGRIIAPDRYCECIEKKLPSLRKTRSTAAIQAGERIEQVPGGPQMNQEQKIHLLIQKLARLGMQYYAIDLLIARIVEGQTLKRITKEQKWTSTGSANYHLRRAYKTVRERWKK